MGIDLKNMFQPANDEGSYDTSQDYQSSFGRTSPVPPSWGDAIGDLLGTLGNVRRAQRNSQSQALLRAWDEAKAAGPEAAQQFLRNPQLPQWFRDKVLAGITPEMFDPQIRAKAQGIYQEARKAMSEIYAQAAAIQDPAARDKFIDDQIETLKKAFPDWGAKIPPLPRNPDGHYAVPGMGEADTFLDQTVMLPNGKPMMNPATGKPYKYRDLPPDARAKVETQAIMRQAQQQGSALAGKPLRQVAPQLVAALKGTSYETMLDQLVDSFLDDNGNLDAGKLEQLIAAAGREKAQVQPVWIDPKTGEVVPAGTPGAIQVDPTTVYSSKFGPGAQKAEDKGNAEARLRFAARVKLLDSQMKYIKAQIDNAQRLLGNPAALIGQDPTKPDSRQFWQRKLQELLNQQTALEGKLAKLYEEDPDLGVNPPGVTGNGEQIYRNNRAKLVDAIFQAEGGGKGLDAQWRGKLDNKQWIGQNVDALFKQWVQAGKPGDFLQWLASKWAPVGAANDPSNKNSNWLRNVQAALGTGQPNPQPDVAKVYTDADYAALAQTAMAQIKKGLSYKLFVQKILEANPGMDEKKIKAIWDSVAKRLQQSKGKPQTNMGSFTQWITNLPWGQQQPDPWSQQP